MEHVAIDLGGKESQICVRSSDGRILPCLRSPVFDMIDVRLATFCGWWMAKVWLIIPPIEAPTTWALAMPR